MAFRCRCILEKRRRLATVWHVMSAISKTVEDIPGLNHDRAKKERWDNSRTGRTARPTGSRHPIRSVDAICLQYTARLMSKHGAVNDPGSQVGQPSERQTK